MLPRLSRSFFFAKKKMAFTGCFHKSYYRSLNNYAIPPPPRGLEGFRDIWGLGNFLRCGGFAPSRVCESPLPSISPVSYMLPPPLYALSGGRTDLYRLLPRSRSLSSQYISQQKPQIEGVPQKKKRLVIRRAILDRVIPHDTIPQEPLQFH